MSGWLDVQDLEKASNYEVIPWSRVAVETELGTTAQVCRGLMTSIGALNSKYADERAAEQIIRYAEERELFLPSEDHFQAYHLLLLKSWFDDLGVTSTVIQGEFGTQPAERMECPAVPQSFVHRPGSIRDESGAILVTVAIDSFFTVVAGANHAIDHFEKLVRLQGADGMRADEATIHGWWQAQIRPST